MEIISYKGYKNSCITVINDGASIGDIVMFNSSGHVVTAPSGSPFFGVCVAVRGDYATIQIEGYAELQCNASISKRGYVPLISNGSNTVCESTVEKAGKSLLVVELLDNNKVGVIL